MIRFDFDKEHNRVVIKMAETVSFDDANTKLKEFVDECNALGTNFTIINDISELIISSEEELRTLNRVHLKLMDLFMVGKVIRVLDATNPLYKQLKQIDKEFDLTNITYVNQLEEAMAFSEKE